MLTVGGWLHTVPAQATVTMLGRSFSEAQLTMTAGTYRHPEKGSPFDERNREYADQDLREQEEKEDR